MGPQGSLTGLAGTMAFDEFVELHGDRAYGDDRAMNGYFQAPPESLEDGAEGGTAVCARERAERPVASSRFAAQVASGRSDTADDVYL